MKWLFFALLPFALAACASDRPYSEDYYSRFDDGFRRLGASEDRRRCISQSLAGTDPRTIDEVARIIEESADRSDMRSRVLGAGEETRRAFIRANFGCSLTS